MGDIIVIQFITLDGVVSDPDGRGGTGHGGWAFKFGSGPVDGDKFRLGSRLADGVHLYGRRTWEAFATLWPARDGEFAGLMNAAAKRVATRTGIDAGAWPNSAAIDGDPVAWAKDERQRRDVVVIGSLSVVRALAAADLVDEYRLVTFPVVAGAGDRLFDGGGGGDFRFVTIEPGSGGVTALTALRRER
ncbi:dihydrofolate reductase family protein [Actinoplanes oblitus]|uniref:Dihydrofolate reductase family protein n=1 Tax=Actinoplanes oblitus TaxID=3040509 RepID=A0ABY8W607_9ACTN|nr:dihydrofolate reductase family protein [Actinoplanes oblitus]WIM92457.1 dihydrofolate reductase family protein [Actinoplanes oblitus]